ncbi:MAG: hypothetical protein WBV53_03850 [Solirubrobacterales bacterium]
MGLRDRLINRVGEAIEQQAAEDREREEGLARDRQKARESGKYRKMAKHGEVAVPGTGTLELPSGKVKLRYVESIRAGQRTQGSDSSGALRFSAPDDLRIRIVPVGGGDAVEVTPRRTFLRPDHLPGQGTFVTVRSTRIPRPGPYEVSVEGGREGATEPRVVFG